MLNIPRRILWVPDTSNWVLGLAQELRASLLHLVPLAAQGAGIEVPVLLPGCNHSRFHSADLHFCERKMP